ncbi:MAG: EAL domain-containing protein [Proteobacteria bacterium]|nr:EAL domain-containing protein [Pseudomonadota bacterium]HQR03819.1 EAL domain-containing protein [Rhodocyclaceae bacterium]
MIDLHRISLRYPLLLGVLALFGLAFVLSITQSQRDARHKIESDGSARLKQISARLVRITERNLVSDRPEIASELGYLSTDPELTRIVVADDAGRVLLANHLAWQGRNLTDLMPETRALWSRANPAGTLVPTMKKIGPDKWRLLSLAPFQMPATAVELRGHQHGLILVEMDLHPEIDELIVATIRASLPALGAAVLIAALLVILLQKLVIAPLQQLDHGVRRMADGEPLALAGNGPAEVVRLAQAFTDAHGRLQRTMTDLAGREAELRRLINIMPVGIFRTDPAGHCRYVSERWSQITGLGLEQIMDTGWEAIIHPDELDTMRNEALLHEQSARPFAGEFRIRTASGLELWGLIQAEPEWDESGRLQGYLGSLTDITRHKQAEAEIQRLAYHDAQTGLPNRQLFLDRCGAALATRRRTGQTGAVLYLDLDQFRKVNDARGHQQGDQLLDIVAARFGAILAVEDTLACLGGDDFAVLIGRPLADAQEAGHQARALADRLRAALHHPVQVGGEEVHLTASIGISTFPKGEEQVGDLLKEAETAMYGVKSSGGDGIHFFETSMQAQVEARFSLENELRRALARDELVLHLQAQVDAEGAITGAEALIRWQHPERGLVPPGHFIPIAENSSLIVTMGNWVLEQSCLCLARLARAERPVRISVNVSPRQFRQTDFVQRVKDTLTRTGADPAQLVLEVTEGLVIGDVDQTVARMQELRALGIRFSIDDFGTGYSALSYLKRLPVSELKIDKSFVQDAPRDADDAALVEVILAVARHMDLEVVAEGVETEEQAAFLRQRGCDLYQGYLYSRPQPAAELLATLGL